MFPHLYAVDRVAYERLDHMIPALAKAAGATEALMAADPMKWVGLMNACKAQAEEVVLEELIYIYNQRQQTVFNLKNQLKRREGSH